MRDTHSVNIRYGVKNRRRKMPGCRFRTDIPGQKNYVLLYSPDFGGIKELASERSAFRTLQKRVKDEGIAFFEYGYEEEKMGEIPPSNVYELAEELEYLGYEVNVKRVI